MLLYKKSKASGLQEKINQRPENNAAKGTENSVPFCMVNSVIFMGLNHKNNGQKALKISFV